MFHRESEGDKEKHVKWEAPITGVEKTEVTPITGLEKTAVTTPDSKKRNRFDEPEEKPIDQKAVKEMFEQTRLEVTIDCFNNAIKMGNPFVAFENLATLKRVGYDKEKLGGMKDQMIDHLDTWLQLSDEMVGEKQRLSVNQMKSLVERDLFEPELMLPKTQDEPYGEASFVEPESEESDARTMIEKQSLSEASFTPTEASAPTEASFETQETTTLETVRILKMQENISENKWAAVYSDLSELHSEDSDLYIELKKKALEQMDARLADTDQDLGTQYKARLEQLKSDIDSDSYWLANRAA